MSASWSRILEVGPQDSRQAGFIAKYEYHQQRLVDLGFLERRELHLLNVKLHSLQYRRLYEELNALTDRRHYAYFETGSAGEDESVHVTIWDTPDRVDEPVSVAKAHDCPALKAFEADREKLKAFGGTWVNEEGKVVYTISAANGGRIRIEPAASEPWQIEIRNFRAGDGRILFDQYHYTPPQDELKSPSNKDGHHPFSGVRCQVSLETYPEDASAMTMTLSTFQGVTAVGTLRRVSTTEDGG